MATTSLWHIKGRLSDLIAYVENPEKTVPKGTEDFFNVFSYIQNSQKTADGSFVTAINCLKQTALRQMILTKQQYGKKYNYSKAGQHRLRDTSNRLCREYGLSIIEHEHTGQLRQQAPHRQFCPGTARGTAGLCAVSAHSENLPAVLYWEYQLGILPKGTAYQPTSLFMREELRKLDEITAQVNYLAKNRIETLDDLLSARETLQCELDSLTAQRTKLQNKIRRASPAEKEQLRGEKQAVTAQIAACRKKLKLNVGVEERSAKIQDTMDMVYANEEQHRRTEQEQKRGVRVR